MSVSIHKDTARGTWFYDVRGPDGRRHRRRGFRTKGEATEAGRALLAELERGTAVEPSRLTVGTYLTEVWLPALEGRNLRATTVDTYRRLVRVHLVPILGAVMLQRLNNAGVERLLAQLASSGLAPKSRRKVVGVLSKALADAQRWHYVTHNAVAGAELPRPTRAAARAWSADQLSAFLAHVEGDRLYPLWRFLVATGCRRGEAVGLRWSDLDLEAGTALIANQRSIAGGSVVEGAPKTAAGARTVALDPETVAVLARWRRDQREEFLAAGVRPERGYVFTGREGGPLWPQGVTDRMAAITRQLGHPPIGVHGLRHSAATWMMGAGVSPKVVQQRLGHANVSVTLGIYSHVMPGHDEAAAAAFGAALRGERA